MTDPRDGQRLFGEYATEWLRTRMVKGQPLSPATKFGYEGLLRRHLSPAFGTTMLRRITSAAVRSWYAALVAGAARAGIRAAAMATIGHSSPVAALRYQHPTEERGRLARQGHRSGRCH